MAAIRDSRSSHIFAQRRAIVRCCQGGLKARVRLSVVLNLLRAVYIGSATHFLGQPLLGGSERNTARLYRIDCAPPSTISFLSPRIGTVH